MLSGAVRALLLIALIAAVVVTEAARDNLIVKEHQIYFRISWWDDGRVEFYQLHFTAYGVSSIYTFDAAGHFTTLKVADRRFTLERDTETTDVTPKAQSLSSIPSILGSKRLLIPQDEAVEGASHSSRRRLFSCTDCEEIWNALCNISLVDVCYWADLPPYIFTKDAQTSLLVTCSAFGAACETSAGTRCAEFCIDGEEYDCVTPPRNDSG